MLTEKKDFIIVPKVTLIMQGVVFAVLVCTRKNIFVVPFETIESAGRDVEIETTTIGGTDPATYLTALAKSLSDVSELENRLMELINKDPEYFLKIADLAEFKIKAGFFSRGIYYKKPNQSGFKAFGVGSKQTALDLQQFYGLG